MSSASSACCVFCTSSSSPPSPARGVPAALPAFVRGVVAAEVAAEPAAEAAAGAGPDQAERGPAISTSFGLALVAPSPISSSLETASGKLSTCEQRSERR